MIDAEHGMAHRPEASGARPHRTVAAANDPADRLAALRRA
jgi:hypothetical protein